MFGGRLSSLVLGAILVMTGCGTASSELTTEEQLEKLAGRPLSTIEITEQLEMADLLCGFDSQVLIGIWDRLDARQLEYQDYVFGQHCPDRLSIYREARPTTGTAPIGVTTSTSTSTTSIFVNVDFLEHIGPATTASATTSSSTTAISTTRRTALTSSTTTSSRTSGTTPTTANATTTTP